MANAISPTNVGALGLAKGTSRLSVAGETIISYDETQNLLVASVNGGAVAPLGAGGNAIALADNSTTQKPDILALTHATSGTAAPGFGETIAMILQNAAGAPVRAAEIQPSWNVATGGAEEGVVTINVTQAGVSSPMAKVVGFGWSNAGTIQSLYLGDPGNVDALKLVGAHAFQLVHGGQVIFQTSTTSISFIQKLLMSAASIQETQTGATAVATTITLPSTGNMWPLTVGTGTLNSIVATGWQAGTRGVLICVSGITITSGVGGTGATIITPTGASIVTTAKRAIPICYDGTNWMVEG